MRVGILILGFFLFGSPLYADNEIDGLLDQAENLVEDSIDETMDELLEDAETLIEPPSISCEESSVNKPPFYISDEFKQGDKVWENFRSIEDHDKKVSFIPRGSIVHAPVELSEASYHPDYRVPVEVLSVPDKKFEDDLREDNGRRGNRHFRHTALTPDKLPRTQVGDQGYLHRNSLIPAGKFTFYIKDGTRLEKTPGGRKLVDFPLTLVKNGENFPGTRCCLNSSDQEGGCFFQYRFAALNEKFDVLETFDIDPLRCGIIEDILPIPKRSDIDVSVGNIIKKLREEYPEYHTDKGVSEGGFNLSGLHLLPEHKGSNLREIYRPYMVKMPIDLTTLKGPFNSYHYSPDNIASNDMFLRPRSLCAFTSVLEKFNQQCGGKPGCQVQYGNFFHEKDWNVHVSHDNGTCIDIRPFRKSSDADSGLTRNYRQYSRQRTKDFIDLLKKAGASPIIFNDSKIKNSSWLRKHDDHIHVCFEPNNKYVLKACNEGL